MAGRWPDVAARVVFMSGGIADEAIARALRALGAPLLEKPLARDDLRALVAAVARR